MGTFLCSKCGAMVDLINVGRHEGFCRICWAERISKMTDAKRLREEYEKHKDTLQNVVCEHKETEWMEYHWAPGHFGGMVRSCLNCEKILERK